jgi:hypothetical protein
MTELEQTTPANTVVSSFAVQFTPADAGLGEGLVQIEILGSLTWVAEVDPTPTLTFRAEGAATGTTREGWIQPSEHSGEVHGYAGIGIPPDDYEITISVVVDGSHVLLHRETVTAE